MAKEEEINYIVRIAGKDLDGKRSVWRAIQRVNGVGPVIANAVVQKLGYGKDKILGKLSDEEVDKLEESIKNPASIGLPNFLMNRRKDPETGEDLHLVGVDLKLNERSDIEFLKKIKSNKGFRHEKGLKVRGQRTQSTGRSGATVGVSRKKVKAKKKKGEGK